MTTTPRPQRMYSFEMQPDVFAMHLRRAFTDQAWATIRGDVADATRWMRSRAKPGSPAHTEVTNITEMFHQVTAAMIDRAEQVHELREQVASLNKAVTLLAKNPPPTEGT